LVANLEGFIALGYVQNQWHSIQQDGKLLILFTDFRFRAWTVAPGGGK